MFDQREGYNSPEYKAFRYAVMARDQWACQLTGQKGSTLEVHHIIPWAKAPNLRYAISNGITLSKEAHDLVTGREEQFQEQFQRIVASKKGETRKTRSNKSKLAKVMETFKWRPRNPRLRY